MRLGSRIWFIPLQVLAQAASKLSMMSVLVAAVLLLQAPANAPGRPLPPPPAQDLTLPPETASTITILEGRGVQIYTCTAEGPRYSWVFKAPEAQLFNLATGKPVGHHDAGPTWTLDDGSSTRGTVLHNKAAGNPAADVPWLLLAAQPVTANGATPAPGTLSTVTYVRRYNTHGGAAPATGCDAAQAGQTLRVPYTATYAFYATPGSASYFQTGSDLKPAPPAPNPGPRP